VAAGSGLMSSIPAFTCPKLSMRALREAAFHERCKIHDIIMQGIDAALRKRGYPSVETLKARRKR